MDLKQINMTAMKTVDNILYAGIFVGKEDKDKLMSLIPEEFRNLPNFKEMNDLHVTLFFKSLVPIDMLQYALNKSEQEHTITIDAIGYNDKAIALRVFKAYALDGSVAPSTNKVQHITLAVANDGKPVDSNNITNWKSIDPIVVKGFCRVIYRHFNSIKRNNSVQKKNNLQ